MKLTEDIYSMTQFKRRTVELTTHMRRTGRPLVLTVHGQPAFVVLAAVEYEKLLANQAPPRPQPALEARQL